MALHKIAEKAPFGKGTETGLDKTNKKILPCIVTECSSELRLPSEKHVKENLYKLLLYKQGPTGNEGSPFGT